VLVGTDAKQPCRLLGTAPLHEMLWHRHAKKGGCLLSFEVFTWIVACTGLLDAKLPTATQRLNLMSFPLAFLLQSVALQVS
jgi:hypothetical protein